MVAPGVKEAAERPSATAAATSDILIYRLKKGIGTRSGRDPGATTVYGNPKYNPAPRCDADRKKYERKEIQFFGESVQLL